MYFKLNVYGHSLKIANKFTFTQYYFTQTGYFYKGVISVFYIEL